MNKTALRDFCTARSRFRTLVDKLSDSLPDLCLYEQKLVEGRGAPFYKIETPVVYNKALDDVEISSEIKLILVADNPGRREQAAENRAYLVGPSGKIAERFFRDHMGIDFRKNVIILNKTPIHTPRTVELKELAKLGGKDIASAIASSQRGMAQRLLEFHSALAPVPVWIIGYSEMKKRGIFEEYTETLKSLYGNNNSLKNELYFFRHFSMNQFTFDLSRQRLDGETTPAALKRMGEIYRKRVLGW